MDRPVPCRRNNFRRLVLGEGVNKQGEAVREGLTLHDDGKPKLKLLDASHVIDALPMLFST